MARPPAGTGAGRTQPAGERPAAAGGRAGRAGLALTAVSITLTFTVALLGPSLMEPPLPGRPGQPPWSVAAHPSGYLVVALTAAAVAAGTAGLALIIWATRQGWSVSPRLILAAGIVAAAALTLVPPLGSSDHLSYAAYGRMVITGHDPYTTTPAALARLGDPVARAVEDWRSSPSVYGALATGGQALASLIGGTSVRLTVFALSVLNLVMFALTGLLLHRLGSENRARQLRAALLWTCNPLLLQVLVAGAHVDSQAVLFAIGALTVLCLYLPARQRPDSPVRQAVVGAAAGGLVGLGFAVKATMVLVGAGLALGCVLAWRVRWRPGSSPGWRGPSPVLGGLALGFCVTAGISLLVWGPGSVAPALHAGSFVSIGSPWRVIRSLLRLGIGESAAGSVVKGGAVLLAVVLLWLLAASIRRAEPGAWPVVPGLAPASGGGPGPGWLASGGAGPAGEAALLAPGAAFAVTFAWLVAWPYVLPWYDGLGWALLALLPWSRLDWLMLARTAALASGYLPARGIALPAGLRWLETVVRTALTPVILLAVGVALLVMLRPRRALARR
jgi:hypothetical protein